MYVKGSKGIIRHLILVVTLVISFGLFGSLGAQDVTPTPTPTDVSPTLVPTDAPTEPPTVAPTDVPPTLAPTDVPPTDVPPTLAPTDVPTDTQPTVAPTDAPTQDTSIQMTPTDVLPTDVPTQDTTTPVTPTDTATQDVTADVTETATPEVTAAPTVASEPPVFNFADGTTFTVDPTQPMVVQGTVSDSLGMVTVMGVSASGTITLTTTPPTETSAPFTTLVTVSYTPAADFSGQDNALLTAINQAGVQATITLSFNIAPPVTPTLIPTPSVEPMKELIIQYNPSDSEETIQAMLASINAVEEDRLPQIGAMRILVPESISQPSMAMATMQSTSMAQLAGISHAEVNSMYHLSYTPNDQLLPQQWGMSNTTGGIYASYAWDIANRRGAGVVVAVVDSGVDLQHPDLASQIVRGGWDFYNDDSNPDDDIGHGTHVAGIIAAQANNRGVGVAGVAFGAKILPIKVCGELGCPVYFIAEGIIYAVDKGARIINISLGGIEDSTTLHGAVNYALSHNVVVVAAAGNTGCVYLPDPSVCPNTVEYPAFYPGVISVGAHDSNGDTWNFNDPASIPPIHEGSTYNSNVLISAPGVGILSDFPVELDTSDGTPDGYTMASGTSMATAYVSGTAALLMGNNVAQTPATVRDALICGAEDAGDPGWDPHYGYGRLKADLSLNWRDNSASCTVTLPNDDFQSAARITRLPFSMTQAVSDRSVTEQASDPQICGIAPEQTLWYTYYNRSDGYYQFTTLGSSYNNVIGVFRGSEGALTSVGCTTTMQLAVPLSGRQTYYIAVGTNGTAVNDQMLQFRINPVITRSNADYQEVSTVIAYVGMWSRTRFLDASGRYTEQTSDPSAGAAFSFRGLSFDYVRTVGPDHGAVQIYINGSLATTVSNRAAIVKSNQVTTIAVPNVGAGNWNTVYIKPDSSVNGVVDIDRIRTYDFDTNTRQYMVTSIADDGNIALRYSNNDWSHIPGGSFYNSLTQTSTANATVTFRFRGNTLTLFRTTGPSGSFSDMQVTIDNVLMPTVSNTSPTLGINPYTIDNLAVSDHVAVITNVGNNSGTIQLDAVQAANRGSMRAGATYDDRAPYISYRGTWTDAYIVGAYARTTRSLDAGSEASFQFSGNNLCIGYELPNAPFAVYIDGTSVGTIAENSVGLGFTVWCLENDEHVVTSDTLHYVQIVVGTGTTATTLPLDYVKPMRYNILTAARRIVQETDPAFMYGTPADWIRLTSAANSPGGFRPQGGALMDTTIDNSTITFYINGTGFILYTAIGPSRGCWMTNVDGVDGEPIDLAVDNYHYRPLGYGISGLTPGIHRIQLTSDTDCSSFFSGLDPDFPVDFDAIRVFP